MHLDRSSVEFLAPLAFKQARTFHAGRVRLRRLDLFEAAQRGPTFHGPDESHARCISRVWRKLSADDLVEKTELADDRRVELDTLAHYRAVLANDTWAQKAATLFGMVVRHTKVKCNFKFFGSNTHEELDA